MKDARPNEIHVHIPVPDTDEVSEGLRRITRKLIRLGHARDGFGFGGSDGYGADYENDVFMMHHFCWCEREDCFWCGKPCGCEKVKRPGRFLDGKVVTKKKYEAWHATIVKPLPWEAVPRENEYVNGPPDWWSGKDPGPKTPEYVAAQEAFDAYVKERDRRSGYVYYPHVHTCGNAMFYDQTEERRSVYAMWPSPCPGVAPHFWHKASGSRVWWYKYIGRDMEVSLTVPWKRIERECLRSIVKESNV